MPLPSPPELLPVYRAQVDIGERRSLGSNALGHRYIVDILGGSFEGPGLRGLVLPGGADRQLPLSLTALMEPPMIALNGAS